jgi:hypothetical protein
MSDPFSRAGSGGRITDFEDNLILFTPREYLTNVETKFGDTDAVDTDAVVLDAEGEGVEDLGQIRVFQGHLVGALKVKIGSNRPMLLGRLRTAPNTKGGKDAKPMWILESPTDADAEVARAYLKSLEAANDPFA